VVLFTLALHRQARLVPGLLLAVALMVSLNFLDVFARPRHGCGGQLTACKSNLKNIGTALEMYSTDFAGRYPTSSTLLTPNYLKTIPTCASVGSCTYVFQMGSSPDLYTVICGGENHKSAGVQAPNYPQYTSVTGLIERP